MSTRVNCRKRIEENVSRTLYFVLTVQIPKHLLTYTIDFVSLKNKLDIEKQEIFDSTLRHFSDFLGWTISALPRFLLSFLASSSSSCKCISKLSVLSSQKFCRLQHLEVLVDCIASMVDCFHIRPRLLGCMWNCGTLHSGDNVGYVWWQWYDISFNGLHLGTLAFYLQ